MVNRQDGPAFCFKIYKLLLLLVLRQAIVWLPYAVQVTAPQHKVCINGVHSDQKYLSPINRSDASRSNDPSLDGQ
jgi:hypothetical protein